jgi:hypothetical protein
MRDPFTDIGVATQRRLFWLLFVFSVLTMTILNFAGAPLTTGAAPAGIISYELAGSVSDAERILMSWDAVARERAAFVQGLDFLFVPLYVGAIAFGCSLAANVIRGMGSSIASLGIILIWLVFLAGLLDILENIALIVVLFDMPANPWPQIALWCAVPKFGIVLVGILFTLMGGGVYLFGVRKETLS